MLPKIAHLPGRWFFRPLAICLSFLMLPHIPNLSFMSGVPAAMAQADNSCTPNMNRIIQDICSPGAPSAALLQFENESVAIWLAAHNLPATDAALIYRYGRLELRSELRSFMFTRLLDIVKKSKLEMNAYETAINNWFVNRVWNLEKAMYKAAVDDKNRWKQDLCSWRPDADIARAYNLSYDYYVWCGNSLALLFSAPPVPVKSYFLAAALKNTYGKSVSNFDNGPMVLAKTGSYIATQLGVAAASGVAGGAFAAGLVFAAAASLFPYSIGMIGAEGVVLTTTATAAGAAVGPLAIVMIAVMIGTIAAFQAVEREKNFTDLATLDHMLYDAQTLAPDLRSWVGNAQSLHKMQVAFVSATLPEFESTEPTPYHRYKSIFTITLPNGSKSTQNELDFLDWSGRKVFAYDSGSGRWFTTFAQAWLYTTARTEEFTPTLQYFAWGRGLALPQRYTASRLGADRFIVTKGDPVVGDAACPADPISGVSNMGDVSKCLSYITREIRYYSSTGTEATLTLSIAPVFTTSFYQASFVIGAAKTFQIAADGAPPPMITMSSGSTLPQGITFQGSDVAGPGKANLVFNGYAAAGGGGNVLFEAKNSAGTAYKGIDVFVGYDVKITSGGTINATVGVPMSFDVAATGDWVSLTLDSGTLPPGLTFTNKGYSAGVATIAGTVLPRLQVAGTYTFGVKAKNNVAQDVKIFNLVVGWP